MRDEWGFFYIDVYILNNNISSKEKTFKEEFQNLGEFAIHESDIIIKDV